MKIEQVQKNKEKGVSDPRVAKLLAEAREKVYEAIAIQTGDPVEEVKKFFAEVEKANKEAANKEQKGKQEPIKRQHTLFTNLVGTDDLVGICIIVGYQKKDADIEKVQPIKFLTARIIEPLGIDVLATAAVSYENKHKENVQAVAAEAPSTVEEAVTALEMPEEGEGTPPEAVVETEDKEDIPF